MQQSKMMSHNQWLTGLLVLAILAVVSVALIVMINLTVQQLNQASDQILLGVTPPQFAEAVAVAFDTPTSDPAVISARATIDAALVQAPTSTLTPPPTSTPTPPPTSTPTPPPTPTPTPPPTPTPTLGILYKSVWSVQAQAADDLSAVFVNGTLVSAASYTAGQRDSGLTTINHHLVTDRENTVTFAHANAGGKYAWDFNLRQDGRTVWSSTQAGRSDAAPVQFVQQIAIALDGSVNIIQPDATLAKPPRGKWYVRLRGGSGDGVLANWQSNDDIATVLVNGLPVAITPLNSDNDWIDITHTLSQAHMNALRFSAWNFFDDFAWNFQLRHNETIVWGQESIGDNVNGVTADLLIQITQDGEVITPQDDASDRVSGTAVRVYDSKTAAVFFVNDRIFAALCCDESADSGWVSIDRMLRTNATNLITFAAGNDNGKYGWGGQLRRAETTIWGSERSGEDEPRPVQYVQRIAMAPNGRISTLPPMRRSQTPPGGEWEVRVQSIDDIGGILVNGQPVIVVEDGRDSGWVDIRPYLHDDRTNSVRISIWNLAGVYQWDVALRRDGQIVWSQQQNGNGSPGLVYEEEVGISAQGDLVVTQWANPSIEHNWSARTFAADDVSAVFVNGQMIGVATYGFGTDDSGWLSLDGYLAPGRENIIDFASSNTGGGNFSWAHNLRQNGIVVWQAEEAGWGDATTLQDSRQIIIAPDGAISLKPLMVPEDPSAGLWYVRIQDINDVGAVLVNGAPVALVNDKSNSDWIDISRYLMAGSVNQVRFQVWNNEESAAWSFQLKHTDAIVWSHQQSEPKGSGLVFDVAVTIGADGKLLPDQPLQGVGSYEWFVRAYATDDVSAIFVDNVMVAAATYGQDRADTGMVDISQVIDADRGATLAVANSNQGGASSWGFLLQRDDNGVWGAEGETRGDKAPIQIARFAQIAPSGAVTEVTFAQPNATPLQRWYVRIEDVDDVGSVVVNGVPVLLTANEQHSDWVEITPWLADSQDNTLTFAAWNFVDKYKWHISVRRDTVIVWESQREGAGRTGLVLNQDLMLLADGTIDGP